MFNAGSLNRLVTEAISRGDYAEALRLADFAIDQYAERTFLRVGKARAQWLAGDSAAAEATLQAALEIAPEDATAQALLARIQAHPTLFEAPEAS